MADDDLKDKMNQVIDKLGPDNLRQLISALSNGSGNKETRQSGRPGGDIQKEGVQYNRGSFDETDDVIHKVRKVMNKMSGDPRINLLTSIRPFLGNKRQKTLNNCIQFLRIASISKLTEDDSNDG